MSFRIGNAKFGKPNYDHDCGKCIFLGTDRPTIDESKANLVDLYAHRDKTTIILIRRFGSDLGDYSSVLDSYANSTRYHRDKYGLILHRLHDLEKKESSQ